MFHKFNKNQFKRTFSNLKNHAIHGYHHMKNIAHNIDYGVSVAKDVYRILEPVIKECRSQPWFTWSCHESYNRL